LQRRFGSQTGPSANLANSSSSAASPTVLALLAALAQHHGRLLGQPFLQITKLVTQVGLAVESPQPQPTRHPGGSVSAAGTLSLTCRNGSSAYPSSIASR
jgi:hypothetical protein